jgi:Fic-DOC domain mobile mystery protein B
VKFKVEYAPGATPLDPNEISGLLPSDIVLQAQLNEAEQANILRAEAWAFSKKHGDVLSEAFVKRLHKEMFQDVWRWAGQFRKSDKSIGVGWLMVGIDLKKLLDDTRYWIEHKTYPWDELGARFHHRLVLIHPFPNGNGRHARLMTDLLLTLNGQNRFTWGAGLDGDLYLATEVRVKYIDALRNADAMKFGSLIDFVRK